MVIDSAAANDSVLAPGTVLSDLPIFPLPNAVHFPNTLLPLHVFEPRYRQLVRAAMAGPRRIAVALLAPGWEPQYYGAPNVHPVMGLGEIINHQELPDGRSNILLRGLARVRLLDEHQTGEEYRTVRARVEESEPGRRDELQRHLATVRQLFADVVTRVAHMDLKDAHVLFERDIDPAFVLDAIASATPAPPERKQALLDELNVERRALLLADLLAEVTAERGAPAESRGWTPSADC